MTLPRALLGCPRPLLILTLLTGGCAGKSPATATAPKGEAIAQQRWPGEPDARVARLVAAAAGDNLLALGMLHAEAWTGLSHLLTNLPPYRELAEKMPWLTSEDLWQPMQMALGLQNETTHAPRLPALAGWDHARPVAVAWLDSKRHGLIEGINAVLFDDQSPPLHFRVVVPATDAVGLAKAFQDSLATLPGETAAPGQYVLELDNSTRLAMAVVAGEDHVRLDVLYFFGYGSAPQRQTILRQLKDAVAPGKGNAYAAADPIARLLANGHGAVLTVRPTAIAQRLLLDGPRKIVDALANVDGTMRASLKAMGTSEVLSGYLVAAAGEPELAELALALKFEGGLEAVSLTRLTAKGQQQMGSLFRSDARTLATDPDALFSASLVLPPNGAAAKIEPLFSPAYRVGSLQDLLRVVQEGGLSSWMALMARPMGLWRSVQEEKQLSRELRLPASWPTEASLEMFDLTNDGSATFRVRGRLPKGDTAAATWASLAKQFSSMLGEGKSNIQEEARPDATWVTWRQSLRDGAKLEKPEAPVGLAQDPAGTFAVVRIACPALADRLQGPEPGGRNQDERLLFEALRLLGQVESRTRWQDGWLIGEIHAGAREAAGLAPYRPVLPPPVASTVSAPTPGRLALERAVVEARKLLSSAANVDPAMRVRLLKHHRGELTRELTEAKQDAATRDEAMLLDWLLLQLTKDFEVQEAWEAAHQQPRESPDQAGDESSPERQPTPSQRRPHKAKRSH